MSCDEGRKWRSEADQRIGCVQHPARAGRAGGRSTRAVITSTAALSEAEGSSHSIPYSFMESDRRQGSGVPAVSPRSGTQPTGRCRDLSVDAVAVAVLPRSYRPTHSL